MPKSKPEQPSTEKRVILTLDELAILMVHSRAKAMKVNVNTIDQYIESTKHEFVPLVNFIYESQLRDGELEILKPAPEVKLILTP